MIHSLADTMLLMLLATFCVCWTHYPSLMMVVLGCVGVVSFGVSVLLTALSHDAIGTLMNVMVMGIILTIVLILFCTVLVMQNPEFETVVESALESVVSIIAHDVDPKSVAKQVMVSMKWILKRIGYVIILVLLSPIWLPFYLFSTLFCSPCYDTE